MSTPEGDTKTAIKKWLVKHNITYWMVIPSAYGATTGMSDFICILPNGKFLAIEAKAAHRRTEENMGASKNQQSFLNKINLSNGIGIVACDASDLQQLEKLI